MRIALPTFTAIPLLQLVSPVRYSDTVGWRSAALWVYLVFLASLFVLGTYGLRRTWFATESPRVELAS